MFLTKNRKFLEFSKSLSYTSEMQHNDYENISAVQCTCERGQMTKFNKVATTHNCDFRGVGVFFSTLYSVKTMFSHL